MTATAWTAVLAGAALLGQAMNLVLYLRIRVAVLELQRTIEDRAECVYRRRETCDIMMTGQEKRIAQLEENCA